jgi:Lysyl oxidase
MAANLVPIVRGFRIESKAPTPCEVIECGAQGGTRKLLRFDFLCWNAGNTDLHVGSPSANPQWFQFSNCPDHNHYHLKDFNDYRILDCQGVERRGKKQAFCLMDVTKIKIGAGSARYTCADQGVSAGWADVYGSALECQWIDITGLANGEYLLEARTNVNGIFTEDSYGDNVTWAGLRIQGNTVTEIPVPCYLEDCVGFNPRRVAAQKIGGRWKVVDGNHWMMDFGSKEADAKKAVKILKYYKMNQMCFVGRPSRKSSQLMMYFRVNGQSPVGPFPGEDAIPFNPQNVAALKVGDNWKVVEGAMWMLDFGPSEANARKAAWVIKKYGFTRQCFVGRPNAPMMYFRT